MLARKLSRPARGLRASSYAAAYSSSAALYAGKPRVVVLGSGWGGFAFAKSLDLNKFDVTLVR